MGLVSISHLKFGFPKQVKHFNILYLWKIFRILIQILCSYVTLPLYALVTQVKLHVDFYLLFASAFEIFGKTLTTEKKKPTSSAFRAQKHMLCFLIEAFSTKTVSCPTFFQNLML